MQDQGGGVADAGCCACGEGWWCERWGENEDGDEGSGGKGRGDERERGRERRGKKGNPEKEEMGDEGKEEAE